MFDPYQQIHILVNTQEKYVNNNGTYVLCVLLGSQHTMDVASLQKMITEDLAVGRIPLIVIADAGTPITGHVDNIPRLYELCKTHDMWLHLRGHSLAALTLPNYQHNGHVRKVIRILGSFALYLALFLVSGDADSG